MPINASSTGRLRSIGALRKCSSIACAPSSSARKPSPPIASAIASPTDDHSE
jgi:hypothetical protein